VTEHFVAWRSESSQKLLARSPLTRGKETESKGRGEKGMTTRVRTAGKGSGSEVIKRDEGGHHSTLPLLPVEMKNDTTFPSLAPSLPPSLPPLPCGEYGPSLGSF